MARRAQEEASGLELELGGEVLGWGRGQKPGSQCQLPLVVLRH